MKLVLAASLMLFTALSVSCRSASSEEAASEPDLRPELQVSGRVDAIEVSPAGEIWFGTATGHVYSSRDWNRTWREVTVPAKPYEPSTVTYDNISQVRFFDAQHAIIAGYLGDSQDLIYRTSDGGLTWSSVTLPSSLWVYDARTTPGGLAWLVGSDGSLLFSQDFGAAWTAMTAPFDDVERSHTVHFVSRSLGVVGSLHGSLARTDDGGRTWNRIETPRERNVTTCEEARVERARILDESIVVEQCGGVYVRALHGNAPWRRVVAEDRPVLSFELTSEGTVGVASDLEVVRFGPDLRTGRSTGFHLEAYPLDIAVGSRKVVFIDGNLKVSVLDRDQFTSARMLKEGVETRWPILARDRATDGTFWGISRFFLYRSSNVGATWERQAELPQSVEGVAVQSSGDVLLWNRHGYAARWDRAGRRIVPVPGLEGLDIVGLFRRGQLWLAYGGMQYETTQRIEVARTYFSGQFAGSADHGFVAASSDGGATWRGVDQWKDAGVQAVFLAEDNTLTLLSWLGAVRTGRLVQDASGQLVASLETILPANQRTWHKVPYVEQAHVVFFAGAGEGWVKGWTHHLGDFLFHTLDGGRTWAREDAIELPPDELFRLGDGSWLGFTPPRAIHRWSDGRFASAREFDQDIDWAIVDASGSFVLQLENGETWSMSPGGIDWKQLSGSTSRAP